LKSFTTKQVLKAIGELYLKIINAGGYWCFSYDDEGAGLFHTYSIYTVRYEKRPNVLTPFSIQRAQGRTKLAWVGERVWGTRWLWLMREALIKS
jgi:hypothetical protein